MVNRKYMKSVGYGFDIHELARNLPDIYALRES